MPKTQNRAVMNWIYTFVAVAMFLVVFGGSVFALRVAGQRVAAVSHTLRGRHHDFQFLAFQAAQRRS